jgi:hypothetical protein
MRIQQVTLDGKKPLSFLAAKLLSQTLLHHLAEEQSGAKDNHHC